MTTEKSYVSPLVRLELGPEGLNFRRVDIVFHGVDQAGPSFEARIFLNNPAAGPDTALTEEEGYAGSFHVYGYGLWPEDSAEEAPTRDKTPRARAPMKRYIDATEAIRAAAAAGLEITVSIVPVFPGSPKVSARDALKIDRVSFVTHPG